MTKNKLTPLKTKHDIEITIDAASYKLVFKPINKHVQEKLDSFKDKSVERYEDIDSKRTNLKEMKELKPVNDELLKIDDLNNKAEILMENKKYIIGISSLEKEIRDINKTLEDVNTAIETYYKTVFDECISGEDKIKFQNTIEEMGISYAVINTYVNEAVRVSAEKK